MSVFEGIGAEDWTNLAVLHVLTAFGRAHAGTAYGDISVAKSFSGCFFPI